MVARAGECEAQRVEAKCGGESATSGDVCERCVL
jgi:hypothetical protein